MPTELRHIIFSAAEVVEAIILHNRARGVSMPGGSIKEAGLADTPPGAPLSFRIVFSLAGLPGAELRASNEVTVDLADSELAAALIGYCRSRGIPMPVKGSKSLERFGSQIGLIVTIKGNNINLPARLAPG
ncbi:hypothetical protein EAH89_25985 [Roseomonas nepalensis]|uniref:Uncharacterized protein n=1 Tax=Muricoccus nepalensis TaxID=1854500 RepID=A0A502F8K7_9PROT|nr:hypothetical protein [Roseomonas nepalensis]TPG45728.1 hypothetical protein EAH89_25985 [Roseomonas nepalensis]